MNFKLYTVNDEKQMQEAYRVGREKAIKNNNLYHLFFTDDFKHVYVTIYDFCFDIHGMFYPDGRWQEIRWDGKEQLAGPISEYVGETIS